MPFPSKSYNLSFLEAVSFLQADANRVWLFCKPYQFRDCSGCFYLWESLYATNWNLTNPNHTHTPSSPSSHTHTHTLMTNRHTHTHTHLVKLTLSHIKPTPLSFVPFIFSPQYALLATSERVINPHLWMPQTHSLVLAPHSTISISISKAATKHKPIKPLPLFLSIPLNFCPALFLDTIYSYYLHFSAHTRTLPMSTTHHHPHQRKNHTITTLHHHLLQKRLKPTNNIKLFTTSIKR